MWSPPPVSQTLSAALRAMDCDPVSLSQLFPVAEELMLQPLWESRDRYEELKQLDDAAKEVTRAA